jgi:hypothetical protein
LLEGAFDEVFPLFADLVDRGHRLNDTGGRSCESELAVFHLALVQSERSVTKNHEAAVFELAGVVFMEVEHDLLVGEFVVADFHLMFP